MAAPQRPAAAGLAGGAVVRGGVSGSWTDLRAGSVPLHQPEGGLQRVRMKCRKTVDRDAA